MPCKSGELIARADGFSLRAVQGSLNAVRISDFMISHVLWVEHHSEFLTLFGAHGPLDPNKYLHCHPNLTAHAVSISPSQTRRTTRPLAHFPTHCQPCMTTSKAQKALLERTAFRDAARPLVIGFWSMGGMQALAWAACTQTGLTSLSFCATARCWPHNQYFLGGRKGRR